MRLCAWRACPGRGGEEAAVRHGGEPERGQAGLREEMGAAQRAAAGVHRWRGVRPVMPKRTDITSILIIGAGPIVIGQAAEFDYSGSQAVKALKEEGYRVIVVNSSPAAIMTDPELADATYIEPITPEVVAKIIELERPDALLPTMGGQTGLNTAMSLHKDGTLERLGVELIGANAQAIEKAEDRQKFRDAMDRIGLESPKSAIAHNMEEAAAALETVGLPA